MLMKLEALLGTRFNDNSSTLFTGLFHKDFSSIFRIKCSLFPCQQIKHLHFRETYIHFNKCTGVVFHFTVIKMDNRGQIIEKPPPIFHQRAIVVSESSNEEPHGREQLGFREAAAFKMSCFHTVWIGKREREGV